MEKALELRSQDRVDLTSGYCGMPLFKIHTLNRVIDMSRQYKALQVEMIERVNVLEEKVIEYKKKQGRKATSEIIHGLTSS
jgi:hypothetical protein